MSFSSRYFARVEVQVVVPIVASRCMRRAAPDLWVVRSVVRMSWAMRADLSELSELSASWEEMRVAFSEWEGEEEGVAWGQGKQGKMEWNLERDMVDVLNSIVSEEESMWWWSCN